MSRGEMENEAAIKGDAIFVTILCTETLGQIYCIAVYTVGFSENRADLTTINALLKSSVLFANSIYASKYLQM